MTLTLSVAALLASLFGGPPEAPDAQSIPPIITANSEISFGNDGGEYPDDGECDDPRFVGEGMANTVDNVNIGGDASDCASHYNRGNIRLSNTAADFSPAMCAAISFGDDSSDYARDRECDDPRFAGPGTDDILSINDLRADATDCKALCESGAIWLK
ncbi:MAG: hypothetical protein AAF761_00940 [Pseudomonadota bacterium]